MRLRLRSHSGVLSSPLLIETCSAPPPSPAPSRLCRIEFTRQGPRCLPGGAKGLEPRTPCLQSDVSVRSRGADLARQLSVSSREIPPPTPVNGTLMGAPRGAAVSDGGERPSISLPSQRRGEAGGSLSRGSPGRAGAASTKSRRLGTAGWAGRGERDGKVYARNRLRYASSRAASSNPADSGWFAVRTRFS